LKGNVRGIIWSAVPVFLCEDWRQSRPSSVWPQSGARTSTWGLPTTKQWVLFSRPKCWAAWFSQLVSLLTNKTE